MGGLLGPTLAHYEILERLDAGGMGDIYHARDTRLGRSVALKVLPSEMAADPDRIARFEREAKALAALSHPNIVTIYSIEEAEGVHFLTMELIRGRTLTQVLPEFGLALSQLFDFAIPLCDALAAAHARGIVHRDLKPADLMVTDEGRLKVLDFGLAKLQEPSSSDSDTTDPDPFSVTQQGHILGTIPYMSPEQAQGAALDARSDFFSLGIVLYEMASGQRPFEGGSTLEVLSAILKESPRPLTEVKPGVPVHLEEIVERCLEKEPSRRFESAAEIRDELQAVQRQVLGTSNRSVSLLFSLPASTGEIALDSMARATRRAVPGACWLRCDLRTRSGLRAEDSMDPERVAAAADQYIEACRRGAEGAGLDVVGLAEPNSIVSYRLMRPYFEAIAAQAATQGVSMPAILPGLELSAGEQTFTRFLVLFPITLPPERIDGLLRFLFDGRERFDESGLPLPAAASPELLLDRLEAYCRPPTGGPDTPAVILLADADGHHGQLRPQAGSSKPWHGFLARGGFGSLPASFRDLVVRWSASRDGVDLQTLTPERRSVFARKAHWPILEASDPDRGEAIGAAFTWIKLELADLEGVRHALLDPDSRLRPSSSGPPGQSHAHIRRVIVRTTDFFEELALPLSPCLTALIGGRGSGKSTVIECLRFALDRARPADFQENEAPVREAVEAFRSTRKRARDFGESPGIFLPGSQVELELTVAEREYRVVWSAAEGLPRVVTADGSDVGLDVRALLAPRILSQGQIAQIAKDPAAQRRELDALLDSEAVRLFEGRRRSVDEELARLQLRRHKLEERQALLPARETELRRVRDQIELLERGGHRETLELYEAVQHEKGWLDGLSKALESAGREVKKSAQTAKRVLEPLGQPPAGPARDWTEKLLRDGRDALAEAARALEKQAKSLESVREALRQDRARVWRPLAKEAKTRYTQLRKQMEDRGVDFGQHEKLVGQRTQLEREVAELAGLGAELQEVRAMLAEVRSRLVGLGRERVERRRALAGALEQQDADVRMEVVGFGDRREMLAQRERWFGGTGLREQDWELLVDHLYAGQGEDVPERLLALVEALREDVAHTRQGGGALDAGASAVSRLLGGERGARLSRHFFKAVQQGDRVRLDEMERFVPEDWVETRVRAADGSFRPVTQGSVGQRSTAVLSLLLSAGDQPLIIDQPEDDLDNQYVYSAVVGLLRRQKFTRQILIATHNANIPVNGDAELIVALGVRGQERLGGVLAAGSIDRPEVKAQVSAIMEGSAEAFRLRRERYGY